MECHVKFTFLKKVLDTGVRPVNMVVEVKHMKYIRINGGNALDMKGRRVRVNYGQGCGEDFGFISEVRDTEWGPEWVLAMEDGREKTTKVLEDPNFTSTVGVHLIAYPRDFEVRGVAGEAGA
jgi:hypothetical protein